MLFKYNKVLKILVRNLEIYNSKFKIFVIKFSASRNKKWKKYKKYEKTIAFIQIIY